MSIITLQSIQQLLRPGLAAVFGDYLTYPDQWKEIFTAHISDKAVEYEVEMRLLPMAQFKADGGPVVYGDMAQQFTTQYYHRNFGIGLISGPFAQQCANANRVNSGNLLAA
jgi:hypothetical protein